MIEHGNWLIEFCNDWKQLFGRYNWLTFRLCLIEFENDKIMGGYEATIILLGLGVRWRWDHTVTDLAKRVARQVEDLKAERDEK